MDNAPVLALEFTDLALRLMSRLQEVELHANAYATSLYQAVGYVLEIVSGISAVRIGGEEEFYDFGSEPECFDDAASQLDSFLRQLHDVITKSTCGSVPWACIHVRATTFANLLCASN